MLRAGEMLCCLLLGVDGFFVEAAAAFVAVVGIAAAAARTPLFMPRNFQHAALYKTCMPLVLPLEIAASKQAHGGVRREDGTTLT